MFKSLFLRATCLLVGLLVLPGSATGQHQPGQRAAQATNAAGQAPIVAPLQVLEANPRYFTDGSGRAVYLTGSHTWGNLQDIGGSDPPPVFDYAAWLDFLEERNHNFFRLWAWEQSRWTVERSDDNYWFGPDLPYLRTGPGVALDGKPRFDLSQFDPSYFDRLRSRVLQARDRGIYVSVMLFNGWSVSFPKGGFSRSNPWNGHPFNAANNVNGIDGDLNGDDSGPEIHELGNPDVTAIQEAYVRRVIDAVHDLDNVLYEISNESHEHSQDWQYHFINFIKGYEATKPEQHPVGMTIEWPNGDNAELFDGPADWISPRGEQKGTGVKVILLDSDHLCGVCRDRYWVWKSFTRGVNPIFMDAYDGSFSDGFGPPAYDPDDPRWESARWSMGYARQYAERMDLAKMVPRGELSSTGYCLANAAVDDPEYLAYAPDVVPTISVDLSATPGQLRVEWFRPSTGVTVPGGMVDGGTTRDFTPPFQEDAVLYLSSTAANDPPVFTSVPDTAATQGVLYRYDATATDEDGDALTFTSNGPLPGWLALTDHGDGSATLEGTPDNADVGSHAVTMDVSDGRGGTDTQSFTVAVSNTNDPPVFTSVPDTAATQGVLYRYDATATDEDGDALTFTSSDPLPGWLDLTDHGDGSATLEGTPDNGDVGSHAVTMEVSDGRGGTDTQSFTVTVSNTNDPPVFTSVPDTAATQGILYRYDATATDEDGDALTFTSSDPLPGWLDLTDHGDGSATLEGTPDNADVGSHAVTMEVSDGRGGTDTQSFSVAVSNTNDPPVFTSVPDTAATQGVLYRYDATATDEDGDALTFTSSGPLPGWLALTDHGDGSATLEGTPDNADVGSHAVTMEVSDGRGGTDTQSFTVTVSNTNDPPVFTSVPDTAATQGVLYRYDATATDEDGDALTFTSSGPLPGWLDLTDHGDGSATLEGTPENGDVGSHAVTMEVSDGRGGTDTQSFTVTVSDTNDPPVFTSVPDTAATQGVLYRYDATATDDDGDALTFTSSDPLPGWLDLTDHGDGSATLEGTPDNADVGSHAVTMEVSDGRGGTDTQSFTVAVSNTNDPPVFTSVPDTAATQGVLYRYDATATDEDGDALTFTSSGPLPGWLALTDHGDGSATLEGTPDNADVGSHAVTMEVSDGRGGTDTQSFTVTVSNTNDPPVFTSVPDTAATQGVLYRYDATATDDDGDALTFTSNGPLPGWLALTDHGDGSATLEGTPKNGDVGSHAVTMDASDGRGGTDTQSFTVAVSNTNDPPVFTSVPDTAATQGVLYRYDATATDDDGDALTFTSSDPLPGWLALTDHGDGSATLEGTPDNADVGSHAVTMDVSDGRGGTDTQSFTVTVSDTNDPPVFTSVPDTAATQGILYRYDATATDDDGDALTFTSNGPLPGWLDLTDHGDGSATLEGTPDNADVGSHAVTMDVSDGRGGTDTQSFTVTVSNTNDPPSAPNILEPIDGATILITGDSETVLSIRWSEAIDPDSDPVVYQWELSILPSFAFVLSTIPADTARTLDLTYGQIAALLSEAGVGVSESVTLYHRAVASDGFAHVPGAASSAILTRGEITASDPEGELPRAFALGQNYPNPFNPATTITFDLPAPRTVHLAVFDILGQWVETLVDAGLPAGQHSISFQPLSLPSGLYVYRLQTDDYSASRTMTLLK